MSLKLPDKGSGSLSVLLCVFLRIMQVLLLSTFLMVKRHCSYGRTSTLCYSGDS